jgi:hypothetical protein
MTDIKLDGARVVVEGELDTNSRMRVRQNVETAGIWFHQTGPNRDQAFVGMASDDAVGFWGNTGANWGFVMNTSTGDVEVKNGALTVRGTTTQQSKAGGLEFKTPVGTSIVLEKDEIRVTAGNQTIDLVAEVKRLRDEIEALKGKGAPLGGGTIFPENAVEPGKFS